jgi:hypothetical protein
MSTIIDRETVINCLGANLLMDITQSINAAYRDVSARQSRELQWHQHHDLYAQELRVIIDKNLIDLAQRRRDISALIDSNKNKSSYFTLLTCGRYKLTVSAVQNNSRMPRKSQYRDLFSQDSQVDLALPGFQKNFRPDGYIYGIILHGPRLVQQPSFINLGFPDNQCKRFVEKIDLLALYDANKQPEAPMEDVQEVKPKLKDSVIKRLDENNMQSASE